MRRLVAVSNRGFDLGSLARQKMKASRRSLPLYKLKIRPRGTEVSAANQSLCQSQARLALEPQEIFLCGLASDLLQFAKSLSDLCGLGEQLGSRNGERENGRQIACPKFSSEINFFRRMVIVSLRD